MSKVPLIKPTEIKIKSIDGEEKTFMISRVPASRGREIFTQYMPTAIPKIGDYKENEKLMKMLMGYVDVQAPDGSWIRLDNDPVRDSHINDWEMLVKLELEMVKYNTNFFSPDKLSNALTRFNQTLPERIMSTLNRLSGSLSAKNKQA